MKSDDLNNFKKYWLIHSQRYEEAVKKYNYELKSLLSESQIKERTFILEDPFKMEFMGGIVLPDFIIDVIENIMENNVDSFGPGSGNEINKDCFKEICFFTINLETETIQKAPIDQVKLFIESIYSQLLEERNKITKEKYNLNTLIYNSNPISNWFFKRKNKIEELTLKYNYYSNLLQQLQETNIFFTDRIYNGMIKTAKEEFSAAFGINLTISTINYDVNNEKEN